jgi:hypothetical protein
MESKMTNLQEQYKLVEQTYGQDVLNLVLAKGYLANLLENEPARHYLQQYQPDLFSESNPSPPHLARSQTACDQRVNSAVKPSECVAGARVRVTRRIVMQSGFHTTGVASHRLLALTR